MDWNRGTGNRLSARLFRLLRVSFLELRCADLRLSSDAPYRKVRRDSFAPA